MEGGISWGGREGDGGGWEIPGEREGDDGGWDIPGKSRWIIK